MAQLLMEKPIAHRVRRAGSGTVDFPAPRGVGNSKTMIAERLLLRRKSGKQTAVRATVLLPFPKSPAYRSDKNRIAAPSMVAAVAFRLSTAIPLAPRTS